MLVALDPGGTTGIATWDKTNGYRFVQLGPEDHHMDLWNLLCECREGEGAGYLKIICESFEYRQNARSNLVLKSVEYIGVVNLFCMMFKGVEAEMQTASMAKTFVQDYKLKRSKLYIPGKKHAMDALRHLVRYQIVKEGKYELTNDWK